MQDFRNVEAWFKADALVSKIYTEALSLPKAGGVWSDDVAATKRHSHRNTDRGGQWAESKH